MTERELEFSKKPRRITSPPQNQRKWLPGYEGVKVKLETDPGRIAYFAREATWGNIMNEPTPEELADTLNEVASGKVLGSAYKAGLGFRIRASRSSMDQALRLAEGSGGAGSGAGAQTTRDNDQRDFNIIIPNTIEALMSSVLSYSPREQHKRVMLYHRVRQHVAATRKLYGELVDAGVPPQDARYVALPLGFQTQWMHIMSIGNLTKLCEHRLCNGLVQHETDFLVRVMRDLVVIEYPWTDKLLRSSCEKRGECVSGTMLFPPCGAFVSLERQMRQSVRHEHIDLDVCERNAHERARLEIIKYNPDKHLYPAEANDAMQFATWDAARVKLERENPTLIYCMSSEPVPIYDTEMYIGGPS